MTGVASAQQTSDTARKLPIEILPGTGTMLQYITTDSGGVNKLIGNVALRQGENYLYCDSAYIYTEKNNVEAFGSVKIVQPGGTQVESDFLQYTGNTKVAFLRGNVSLTDAKNNLWAEQLTYNLGTKIGVYAEGGTLQSETTTLSSNNGVYQVRTKDARFSGDVFVTDPQYNVISSDLGYNTSTKLVRFFGPSVISNDRSVLHTSYGTWDAINEVGHFTSRTSISSDAQYVEGDQMDYNRKSGLGVVTGNVYALDTAQRITMFCGYAQYNEKSKELLSTRLPVMKKVNHSDSLYIRADTFFAAPLRSVVYHDSLHSDTLSKYVADTVAHLRPDTMVGDTGVKRYFVGYHHVLVFSDSLQARCDSISYSQEDSAMRLMYHPIVWSRDAQMTGDTILIYSDTSSIRRLYIPNNAFIISPSGPPRAQMFDQIQGKTITGFFSSNALREMVVFPNAESIYYSKDDHGAYLGVQQAQSERMKIFFEDGAISKIVLEQQIKQTMTPLPKANIAAMRLSRFRWFPEKRPRSVAEIFSFNPVQQDDGEKQEQEMSNPKTEKFKGRKNLE